MSLKIRSHTLRCTTPGEVARLFVECGVICITAFISPYREDRQRVRVRLAPRDFIEIHMKVGFSHDVHEGGFPEIHRKVGTLPVPVL